MDTAATAETVSAIEAPESMSTETSQNVDVSTETVETQGQTHVDDQQPTDGRTPPTFKEWIKNYERSDPKGAREIRARVYEGQSFRAEFPGGVKEAQALKQFAQSVGGEEGWQEIQQQREQWDNLDALFSEGSPEFVKAIAAEDPAAFAKMVPVAIEELRASVPELHQHIIAKAINDSLDDATVDALSAAWQVLSANEQGKPYAEALAKWFNGIKATAKTVPQPKVDPDRERLNQERQEFEKQQAEAYHNSVRSEIASGNAPVFERAFAAYFAKNNKNLANFRAKNSESYGIMLKDASAKAEEMVGNDKTWMQQFNLVLASGNKEKAVRMARSRMDQVIPAAVSRSARAFMAFGTPSAVPKTNGQTRTTPVVDLPRQPTNKEIDWSRTTASMVLDGKAYLKTRKEMVRFA